MIESRPPHTRCPLPSREKAPASRRACRRGRRGPGGDGGGLSRGRRRLPSLRLLGEARRAQYRLAPPGRPRELQAHGQQQLLQLDGLDPQRLLSLRPDAQCPEGVTEPTSAGPVSLGEHGDLPLPDHGLGGCSSHIRAEADLQALRDAAQSLRRGQRPARTLRHPGGAARWKSPGSRPSRPADQPGPREFLSRVPVPGRYAGGRPGRDGDDRRDRRRLRATAPRPAGPRFQGATGRHRHPARALRVPVVPDPGLPGRSRVRVPAL
jgi:hypothetical protein